MTWMYSPCADLVAAARWPRRSGSRAAARPAVAAARACSRVRGAARRTSISSSRGGGVAVDDPPAGGGDDRAWSRVCATSVHLRSRAWSRGRTAIAPPCRCRGPSRRCSPSAASPSPVACRELGALAAVAVDRSVIRSSPSSCDLGRPARRDPVDLEPGLARQQPAASRAARLVRRASPCFGPAGATRGRGRCLLDLGQQLLGQLALAVGVELLELVLDRAAVVGLVPVVEAVEAEQHRLADELAQHLVGRAHHPAGLGVAQVALELHVALVAGAAAGVEHLVDHVRGVLGRDELDLPRPVQEVGAGELARGRAGPCCARSRCPSPARPSRRTAGAALVSITASPT